MTAKSVPERNIRMLALAEDLLADPNFAYNERGIPIADSAVAQIANLVRSIWQSEANAALPLAIKAISYLPESGLVERGQGFQTAMRTLVRDRLQIARGAETFGNIRLAAEVHSTEDLVYFVAWLRRLWKLPGAAESRVAISRNPRPTIGPKVAARAHPLVKPNLAPAETPMERAFREAEERQRKSK